MNQFSDPITVVRSIATRLKESREEAGLKQHELAKLAGVEQTTISNIESGVRKRPRSLLAIAEAAGVHAKWLESGTGPRYLVDKQEMGEATSAVLRHAYRSGVVQGGDNGYIEDYAAAPTVAEPDAVAYASTRFDAQAYAVKVRGSSMEPAIMAGWDVVASPGRPAEPPDLCVVHFTDSRKGVSTSIGVTGARITKGHGQTRTTVGQPGSGLSHTKVRADRAEDPKTLIIGALIIAALIGVAYLLA